MSTGLSRAWQRAAVSLAQELAARLSVVAYDVAIWAENRIHEIDREADRAGAP